MTDDGRLQQAIADPRHKQPKVYWAQVEGTPDRRAIDRLRGGVRLGDGLTPQYPDHTPNPTCGRASRPSAIAEASPPPHWS